MFYVRYLIIENDDVASLYEGPVDYYFATLLIADVGVDASIPRGLLSRAPVIAARIVPEAEVPHGATR